ncbi:MAG: ParB/RepB/Spo0J family partition protein [Phycisphaeraceae bacterium]|nr:ParB/RepB/Spo0J family partition protein [Phycisphaeraceae bacterium]
MSDIQSPKTQAKKLGRGLDALLSPAAVPVIAPATRVAAHPEPPVHPAGSGGSMPVGEDHGQVVIRVSIDALRPSPFQPRRSIDPITLASLAASIRQSGLMQPVVARARPEGGYELIAGERRWRAAREAGLDHVPVIVRDASDAQAAELALVENIHRDDLNPIDKAWALKTLSDQFGLTQTDLASKVSLERSTVANLIRLTELEPEICQMIQRGELTGAHGKALLAIPAGEARLNLAREAAANEWTTKRVEYLAKAHSVAPERVGSKRETPQEITARQAVLRDLERQLAQQLGTKVIITTDHSGKKGKLSLEFYSIDHFDGLLHRLGISAHHE